MPGSWSDAAATTGKPLGVLPPPQLLLLILFVWQYLAMSALHVVQCFTRNAQLLVCM